MVGINLWTLLFLMIAGQGFLVSGLLFFHRKKKKSLKILGLFTLVFSLILIFWVGFWNDFHLKSHAFELLFFPIPFLLGPLLFVYKRSSVSVIKRLDIVHFVPFFVALVHSTFIYFQISEGSVLAWDAENIDFGYYMLHSVSFLFYAFYNKDFPNRDKGLKAKNNTKSKQILYTILLFKVFALIAICNFLINRIIDLPASLDILLAIIGTIVIYLIGYIALDNSLVEKIEKVTKGTYRKSSVKPDNVDGLIERIIHYLESEKPYLECDYKLDDLATQTQIPSHHISEVLNKYKNQSFSELINTYRISEAKKMLLSEEYKKIKVASIGYEAGFNSKATFYHWFNKIVKKSPSEFQKESQKSSR